MSEEKDTQLHDELLETRGTRLFRWFSELSSVLQVIVGCGAAIVSCGGVLIIVSVLVAIGWGLLLAIF